MCLFFAFVLYTDNIIHNRLSLHLKPQHTYVTFPYIHVPTTSDCEDFHIYITPWHITQMLILTLLRISQAFNEANLMHYDNEI